MFISYKIQKISEIYNETILLHFSFIHLVSFFGDNYYSQFVIFKLCICKYICIFIPSIFSNTKTNILHTLFCILCLKYFRNCFMLVHIELPCSFFKSCLVFHCTTEPSFNQFSVDGHLDGQQCFVDISSAVVNRFVYNIFSHIFKYVYRINL